MSPTRPFGLSRLLAVAAVAAMVLVMPAAVAAHSELKTASPPDGATLAGPPDEIVLTFTAELDPAKSSVSLRDPAGTEIAKAGVDTTDNTVMRIPLDSVTLDLGAYEVRWTSAATDGDLLRGTLSFTVLEPTPAPPTAAPTPSPSATAAATPSPSPFAVPSPSPSATPSGGSTAGSTADVLIPIIAAIVVIGLLGWWLVRNRSRGGTQG